MTASPSLCLADVSGIHRCFSSGAGERRRRPSRWPPGGGSALLKMEGGGWGRTWGQEGVCGEVGGIFVSGVTIPSKLGAPHNRMQVKGVVLPKACFCLLCAFTKSRKSLLRTPFEEPFSARKKPVRRHGI